MYKDRGRSLEFGGMRRRFILETMEVTICQWTRLGSEDRNHRFVRSRVSQAYNRRAYSFFSPAFHCCCWLWIALINIKRSTVTNRNKSRCCQKGSQYFVLRGNVLIHTTRLRMPCIFLSTWTPSCMVLRVYMKAYTPASEIYISLRRRAAARSRVFLRLPECIILAGLRHIKPAVRELISFCGWTHLWSRA